MSLPLCHGCSLTWSVFVSVRMCQMSCWRTLVDLIAHGCVPICRGILHGAQTFLTRIPTRSAGVITERSQRGLTFFGRKEPSSAV